MKISAYGFACNGLRACKKRSSLYDAEAAIKGFHDALLAVANGIISPEQLKDFFWNGDTSKAQPFGGVLEFKAVAQVPGAKPEPIAYLRDVDGTGSLHACSREDAGAIPVYECPELVPNGEAGVMVPLLPTEKMIAALLTKYTGNLKQQTIAKYKGMLFAAGTGEQNDKANTDS